MGLTMAEKILARASGRAQVAAGDSVTATPDRVMVHESFALAAMKMFGAGSPKIAHPERVAVVLSQAFPAPADWAARTHQLVRSLVRRLDVGDFLGHDGVCNQVLMERALVLPGQLAVGSDAHCSVWGAMGAAGAGLGLTETAYVLATGELWFSVPPSLRVVIHGDAPEGVTAMDLGLHWLGTHGADFATYRSVEFAGGAAGRMSVASRMTLSNMAAELGAKFALFAADDTTLRYLGDRHGRDLEAFGPDADAVYEDECTLDVSTLSPQVACPHSPGNVRAVESVAGQRVHQAYLGSCANGRLEDLRVAAEILRGRQVHSGTRLVVNPASQEILLEATRAGYVEVLLAAGAQVTQSGCGACGGVHCGLIGDGEVCIASTNRNLPGQMGSTQSEVYLASAATVVASAVAGCIADPRDYWAERFLAP